MFGVIYFVIGGCLLIGSYFHKIIRDEEMKKLDTTDLPFWMDSTGIYHWKSNDEKINGIDWDDEHHLIIYNKHWKKVDITMREIEKKLNSNPNLILEYGKSSHSKGTHTPGYRYITMVNGVYKFYTIVEYKGMLYYFDIETEKVVMPVPEAVQREKNAKKLGYEYKTDIEIKKGMDILNQESQKQGFVGLKYRYLFPLSKTDCVDNIDVQKKAFKRYRQKIKEM